jgi:hypothetical protein
MSGIMLERSGIVKPFFRFQEKYFELPEKRYNPVKPKGRVPMTIAAGFRCSDGVVVCADREHTTDIGKFSADKVLVRKLSKECQLVVTGAGASDFIGITADSVANFLKPRVTRLQRDSDLFGLLNEWGHKFYEAHFFAPKAAKDESAPFIASIIGTKVRRGTGLWKITETGAAKVIPEDDCIGSGENQCRALASWLYWPGMPARTMREFATHMIRWVGEFALNCGRQAQVETLLNGDRNLPPIICERAEFFDGLCGSLAPVLGACEDSEDVNDEDFEELLFQLCGQLRGRRRKRREANEFDASLGRLDSEERHRRVM